MGHNNNYHKFSQFKKPENKVVTEKELNPLAAESEEIVEEVFETVINEITEETNNENPVIEETKGYLTNCIKLNVRAEAEKDADVLCILDQDAEVTIDLDNSTAEFYKVCTSAGVEGYCMKKYIAVK